MPKVKKSCPSATNSKGASLFGIVNAEGRVAFLPQTVPLTDDLIEAANNKGKPESKFRYTTKCVEKGCNQWTGNSCGVITHLKALEFSIIQSKINQCPIRQTCRWFFQEGESACKICPNIVADFLDQ